MQNAIQWPPHAKSKSNDRPSICPELLTAREAARLVGLSLRGFHYHRDRLPPPIPLSEKIIRWRRSDLLAWIANLPAGASRRVEPAELAAGRARKLAQKGGAPANARNDNAKPVSEKGIGRRDQESNGA
jgi:predicted DNA-binding transcriptional regulator AlpA